MAKAATPTWVQFKKDGKTPNKAGTIKAYDEAHPGKSTKEVVAALKAVGIEATDQAVYNARKGSSSKAASNNGHASVFELVASIEKLGGPDAVKKDLEKLADDPLQKLIEKAGSIDDALALVEKCKPLIENAKELQAALKK